MNVNNIGKTQGGPSAAADALKNVFTEAKESLINDPNPTKFIEPQTFLDKFGSGRTIQDPNEGLA